MPTKTKVTIEIEEGNQVVSLPPGTWSAIADLIKTAKDDRAIPYDSRKLLSAAHFNAELVDLEEASGEAAKAVSSDTVWVPFNNDDDAPMFRDSEGRVRSFPTESAAKQAALGKVLEEAAMVLRGDIDTTDITVSHYVRSGEFDGDIFVDEEDNSWPIEE